MKRCSRVLGALAACCMLLAGCEEKHEPTKPTVIATIICSLLPF